ncbi:MAG: hypothetical protein VXW41_04690, partial [SAR324 cluster bacterium]|nr:hypothetical protein [SAR324 cluster bacterium]
PRAETENVCVSIACETLNEYKEWTVRRMLLEVKFIVNPGNSLDACWKAWIQTPDMRKQGGVKNVSYYHHWWQWSHR